MHSSILRKLAVFILGMCALFSAALCFAEAPRVGVTAFGTSYRGSTAEELCATAYSELLKGLSERQYFQLLERTQLETIAREHGLNNTGLIDDATAVNFGKLAGVKYMLICNLDFADVSTMNNIVYKARKANVKLSARLIDVETGIQKKIFSVKESKTGKADVMVPSLDPHHLAQSLAQNAMTSVEDSLVYERDGDRNLLAGATEGAIRKLLNEIGKNYPQEGKIVRVSAVGERCTINLGASNGVKEGDTFDVVEEGEALRDPDTGEILGMDMVKVGKIKIDNVNERIASGEADHGKRPLRKGDIVQRRVKN